MLQLGEYPVDRVLPKLLEGLVHTPNAVLLAETGAGKTTRVPLALAFEPGAPALKGQIWLVEPRRVAARSAATFMAQTLGESVGGRVGYVVRFERKVRPNTCVVVVTPGVLLRRLQEDPTLEGVGAIVFDEFHERSLDVDLALAQSRFVQAVFRPELRLVVLSATLDPAPVQRYLAPCSVVRSEGRCFPVEIRHLARPSSLDWVDEAARAVIQLCAEVSGDILVFLPGVYEINAVKNELLLASKGVDIVPLHGRLTLEEQARATRSGLRRRVVLATNVAESSLTVEGIEGVIDTGLAKVMRQHAGSGLDRLVLEPISRQSADQRAGRAGRLSPGVCLRLWTERAHADRAEAQEAELHRVDLSGALLALIAWGEPDLEWLEPPKAHRAQAARLLLQDLKAIDDDGRITPTGQRMVRLPLPVRLARFALSSAQRGAVDEAAGLCAMLSESWWSRSGPRDVQRAWAAIAPRYRSHRLVHQLKRALRTSSGPSVKGAIGLALFEAWPDRVALSNEARPGTGRLVGGRGVVGLPRDEPVVVCVHLHETGKTYAEAALYSTLSDPLAFEAQVVESTELACVEGQVRARRVRRYRDLIVSDRSAPLPRDGSVGRCLLEAALERLPEVLPPEGSEFFTLLGRLDFVRRAGLDLSLESDFFCAILERRVATARSLSQLRAGPWRRDLLDLLDWNDRRRLNEWAPTTFKVPSGRSLTLHYSESEPPILKVKIQEMFGRGAHPTVAAGRVRVQLHLLAPNGRTEQITEDIQGFWTRIYPQVRKELRARYAKHPWPEDPTDAVATPYTKRRRS